MSIVNYRPGHFETSHLLLDHELADPPSVFDNLFIDFRLWEFKDYLWDAQEVCMLTDIPPFHEIQGREECLIYTLNIMKCLEAAKLIVDQRKAALKLDANDPSVKFRDINSLTVFELAAATEYYGDRITYHKEKLDEIGQHLTLITERLAEIEKLDSSAEN